MPPKIVLAKKNVGLRQKTKNKNFRIKLILKNFSMTLTTILLLNSEIALKNAIIGEIFH